METTSRVLVTLLINSLWQVTLVTGMAAACAWLMRNAPARYRHLLWVMALVVSVLLPLWSLPHHNDYVVARRGLSLSVPSHGISQSPTSPHFDGARLYMAPVGNPTGRPRTFWDYLRRRTCPVSIPPILARSLAGCYLLVLLFRLVRMARASTTTRQIRRTAYAREIPDWMGTIAAQCQVALGHEPITILCSSRTVGPLTLGARRPTIILPENLFRLGCSQDLISAVGHEMAHIRRHDFLLNLVYEFLYLPISFHPAAARIKRRIDETRELACDEMVAGRLVSASAYARSLVSIVRAMSTPPALAQPGYTLGVFDANILEERIMRLLDKKPRSSARLARLSLVLASLLLAALCLLASAFSLGIGQEDKSQSDEAMKSFLGTWQNNLQGKPLLTLTLENKSGKLTGTLLLNEAQTDASGKVKETFRPGHRVRVIDPKFEGNTLSFKTPSPEKNANKWEMKLTGDNQAELACSIGAAAVSWKITRELVKFQSVVGGVVDGVPGGVRGGVVGGVVGGVRSEIRNGSEGPTGTISGSVSDPSEARIPNAIITLSNEKTGIYETVAADDAGEFAFTSLPPGQYEVVVRGPGFAASQPIEIVLGPPGNNAGALNVSLVPDSVMQSVEVIAKAPPGAPASPPGSTPRRIRVGGLVQTTKLVESKQPEYPESARVKGIEGTVLLQAVISIEGIPLDSKVLRSPDPELSKAAIDAVRQWRYEPTLLNGEPIEVVSTIVVRFHLARQSSVQ